MLLDHATWVVVDSETTGCDAQRDKPVEIAAVRFNGIEEVERWATLVNPGMPIPPQSSGIHHITDQDVAEAPCVSEALEKLEAFIRGSSMVVAHNAAFDQSFLTTISAPKPNGAGDIEWDWLCTYRLARHLLPNAPDHKLGTLRYLRKLPLKRQIGAHRAIDDVIVTAALTIDLVRLYESRFGRDLDVDELLEFTHSPIWVRTWPFGKYFGCSIAGVPISYMRWALNNHDRLKRDPDLRSTVESVVLRTARTRAMAS